MNLKQRENMLTNIARLTVRLASDEAALASFPLPGESPMADAVREKLWNRIHWLRGAITRRQLHERDLMRKRIRGWQAKWVSDKTVIAAVVRARGRYGAPNWSTLWDVQRELAPVPGKVVLAKLRSMERRGLFVNSCTCGCRGDFELRPELLSL
jgi:hypothetical protein